VKELTSITEFKSQSTWQLVGLGVVTYGVYFAHYIKNQTAKINEVTVEKDKVTEDFVNSILAVSYISLILFFVSLAFEEGHAVETVSYITDRISGVMMIVWGFMARNRLNIAYDLSNDSKEWFRGLWTFLFSPLYFNYKINCLIDESVEQDAQEWTQ
jgi:hypothetical protein